MLTFIAISFVIFYLLPLAFFSDDFKKSAKKGTINFLLYDIPFFLVFSYLNHFYTGFSFVFSIMSYMTLKHKKTHREIPMDLNKIVYINNHDPIYHAASHCGLSDYLESISIEDALSRNYKACKTCNPDRA